VKKAVRDPRLRTVMVYRYRCCHCRRTFRHYPQGVARADQTARMRQLAAICWSLGLSYRAIAGVLEAFGITLSRMSAWRDVQAAGEALRKGRHWQPVRVLGLDGAYVRGWGATQPVLVAVDLGTGQPVALGYVDEKDPQAVRRWLAPLVKRLGVSVIVTDDLGAYRGVIEKLDLEHQVCQFHVKRWVGRTVRGLRKSIPKDRQWLLDELALILEELPPDGQQRLFALYKQLPVRRPASGPEPPLWRLRKLLLRLSENWERYTLFTHDPAVPWTNNATERAIGRMKLRAKSLRGYKTWPGMHNGLLLSGTLLT
jgi:transposase-like protein